MVEGSGPTKKVPLRSVYLNRCGNPSGPDKTGPRELNDTSIRLFCNGVVSMWCARIE